MLWIVLPAAIAVFLLFAFSGYPKRPLGLASLSNREAEIMRVSADTMFPEGGAFAESGSQAGIVAYLDKMLAEIPKDKRLLITLMFVFVELSPWVFGPQRRRFTRLTPADRVTVLSESYYSNVYFRRMVFLSLRTLLCLGYFANDRVVEHTGCIANARPFEA